MKSIQYIWQQQRWPQLTWDAEKLLSLLGECRQLQGGLLGLILDEPGGFQGKLTTRKYASIAKISPATAYRELDQLHAMGVLKRTGKGRSVAYEILMPGHDR